MKCLITERVAIAPIMEDVNNQTALVGSNVTFTCQIVMSDSQPLLQWLRHFKKNDSFVNEKGEPYVKVLQVSERGFFLLDFLISSCQKLQYTVLLQK